MENGNPRSAAHVQEEEESIGGAAAEAFFLQLEWRRSAGKTLKGFLEPAARTKTEEEPSAQTLKQAPHGGTRIFSGGGAAVVPWTRAGFKTAIPDFGRGGGQFLFEVTSTRAADFGGRRRPVRP